jgi:hypothetical protein
MPLRHPYIWAAICSLLLLACALFAVDIDERLFIFSPLIPLACYLLAVILLVMFVGRAVCTPHRLSVVLSSATVLCFGAITLIYGSVLGTRGRFLLLRPYYERRLALVQAGSIPASDSVRTEGRCVAFVWYRGVVDNWVGLVYDPEDTLDRDYSSGMFGGDLVGVHRISRGWFLCRFT